MRERWKEEYMSRNDYGENISEIRRRSYFDISLLIAIVFLVGFGLLMVYSTSSYDAMNKYGDSMYYLKNQAVACFLGFFAILVIIFFDYRLLMNFYWFIFAIGVFTVSLVKVPGVGMEINGARRWIRVAGQSIQPAEILKISMIIWLATVLSKNGRKLQEFKPYAIMWLIVAGSCGLVYYLTDNLSSAIIIGGIAFVMIFVAAPKNTTMWTVGIGIVAALVIGVALLSGTGFRSNRVKVWRNPEKYSKSGGFQVLQGLYAIGSGGFFGKGIGHSVQKLGFVPEPQNDMVFTIICEELGLFGAVAVIVMFIFVLHRMYIIALNAYDLFGSLCVIGVMTHIALQVVLNIAVVTNSIPNTGVTLPFLSYGGTSAVFIMAEIGLVLSVSRKIKVFRR